MTILTPKQIEELMKLIDFHVVKFISSNVSKDYLTSEDLKLLKNFGVDVSLVKKASLKEAFKFGILSQAMATKDLNKMTYDQFKKKLRNNLFLPLDLREQASLKQLEYQAYNDIKGLGNKIKSTTGRVLVEADKKQREKYEGLIKQVSKKTFLDREGVKFMRSELGAATGDWARDFDRIADFILHDAFDNGRAYGMERREGKDVLVYKKVYDRACKYCNELYMDGGKPKVFKLSELRANGTNIGKKVSSWKPVIGSLHPWCRCTLMFVGENKVWDDTEGKFVLKARSKRAEELAKRAKSLNMITMDKS